MKNYIKFSILIIAMSLAACGTHKSSSSDTAAPATIAADANATPVEAAAAVVDTNADQNADVNVLGTWVSACSGGVIEKIDYFKTGMKVRALNFADNDQNCSGSVVLIDDIYADYTISGNKIDSTISSESIMVTSQDQADQFNSTSYLGYTDWTLGKDFDAIGRDGSTYAKEGQKVYGLVKVDGTVLQLGQKDSTNDGTSDAARPDTYDPVLFHKQ